MTAREALAQEWRERLDDFAESETTVQDWCDFNGVSTYQDYYWRRRLAPANSQPQTPSPSFLALDLVESAPIPTPPGGITIRIAGAKIEVNSGFDPAMLRAVVGALATPSC